MLLSLVYFLVGRVLGTRRRSRQERDIKLLVLRHQMRVLQRQVKRAVCPLMDAFFKGLAGSSPRGRLFVRTAFHSR